MDRIRIHGGARLAGAIPISGAKNAALPLIAASLLTNEPLVLGNVPRLADINFMAELLQSFGVETDHVDGTLTLSAARIRHTTAAYDLVRKMRASFLVLGPLLARCGEARVSLPGGCAIGARPVDFHIRALLALGAAIELREGYVVASVPGRLRGARIEFPVASVGATEHAMMAAVLAKGESVIENAAREPEIVDLGHCLQAMGARLTGLGTSRIEIEGVDGLHGTEYRVLPDRIETGTYAFAVAITGGEVELLDTEAELIGPVVPLLEQIGAEVMTTNRGIKISRNGLRPRAVDVTTEPFPGFPTDLQAQFMAVMATADGISHIRETIFENRFMHVPELARMGANIRVEGDMAVVAGVERLKGAPVMATDLRASVSLVLAGLAAEGETTVNRVYHLDRGFEKIEQKLSQAGASIERLAS
ncbi:MAG TPA: UDP-N-acetylglucosamine 1-carboxyvinyltransferase [Rhizomicrobium sp.]|jgi:UDP-N-acetylglucosamine 1-carboxyvinyltransferase|nr:UDP-N-acetylglucosamine 1-carboxyvinyltransferase [Rhizomicrobium sp.]